MFVVSELCRSSVPVHFAVFHKVYNTKNNFYYYEIIMFQCWLATYNDTIIIYNLACGLRLVDEVVFRAVALRQGINVPLACHCDAQVDTFGVHS